MVNLKNMTLRELRNFLKENGFPPFRANQIYRWIYQKLENDPEKFTDLPLSLRKEVKNRFIIPSLKPLYIQRSKLDGTVKYLLQLPDREIIESVIIPDRERRTLCVSSQAGCRMGCKFCYTGKGGWRRNLEPWEIVEQVVVAVKFLKRENLRLTNIVFMGMGEPLDNYENVVKAIKIITEEEGLSISPRRISVSTVGIVPLIKKLIEETGVNLSVSLNAADNDTRSLIMPVNKKYPIESLLQTLKEVEIPRRKRIVIEYVLLKNVNDREKDIENLKKLLRDIPVKINLIPFNPFPGAEFERPDDRAVLEFQRKLIDSGFSVFIRVSKGGDILAACGQLRGAVLNEFPD